MTGNYPERVYTPPLDDDPYRMRTASEGKRVTLVIVIMAVVVVALGAVAWNTYGGGPAPLITAEGAYKTMAPAPAPAEGEAAEVYRVMEGAPVTQISAPGRAPAPAPIDLHPNSGGGGPSAVAEAPLPAPQPAVAMPAAAPVAAGGYLAQLAALRSEDSARQAWAVLDTKSPGLLRGAQMDVQRADLGAQGVFYRLRAGYFADRGQASAFCDRVKGAGAACMVVAR